MIVVTLVWTVDATRIVQTRTRTADYPRTAPILGPHVDSGLQNGERTAFSKEALVHGRLFKIKS